ncbi:hypothetical protein, partial [Staphylococcus aureus]
MVQHLTAEEIIQYIS